MQELDPLEAAGHAMELPCAAPGRGPCALSIRRIRFVLALLGVAAAGVATAFALPASGSQSVVATTVAVKGSDSGARVSPKTFTAGKTLFKIANSGRKTHAFAVNGKSVKVKTRKTVTAKIAFGSSGKFKWSWSGTKAHGVLTVKPAVTTTTVETTTTATTTTTSCTTPAITVNVGMFEYGFNLDNTSVPAGCILFVITNRGAEQHNFALSGIHSGVILAPGGTETWAVQLTNGSKPYLCEQPFHAERGMVGSLTVT